MKNIMILLFLIMIKSTLMFSQWTNDPSINTPVCVWDSYQQIPEIISDDRGGAIITWVDGRNGDSDIFIQRLNSQGYSQWLAGGNPVCVETGLQFPPKMIEDGEGGCIIVWEDNRNGNSDIYAQRVDSSGNILWDAAGVVINESLLDQEDPQIVSDGFGGAIILWEFKQGLAGETGLYAQRINSDGQILWSASGVAIVTSLFPDPAQISPQITSDGETGAIIAWNDFSISIDPNIYAQRVDGSGNILWSQNGIQVRTSNSDKRFQNLIYTGEGKFVISWNESFSSNDWDLRAQKIDTFGNVLWNSEGITICSSKVSINASAIGFNNQNAVIFAWEDYRSNPPYTIYCQKLGLDGLIEWQLNGIAVSSVIGFQSQVKLVCDSSGHTVVCWLEGSSPNQIIAQKFDASGNRLWSEQGMEVSTATSYKSRNNLIIAENKDCIVSWSDDRNADADIYSQSLNALITSVSETSTTYLENFILDQNYPNPFNPNTKISWQSSLGGWQTLKIYDVLVNEVATLVDEYKPAGKYEAEFNAIGLSSGIYFYQLKTENYIETKKMILLK